MLYTFYYRNHLKSCNYKCEYCPFPKEVPSERSIQRDKKYLNKFVQFMKNSEDEFNIFFAPKGEALIFEYYKEALIELGTFKNVKQIVMQTNLSCDLQWLEKVNREKLILWTTYHPKEVEAACFLNQVKKLMSYNVKFTIGAVGIKESFNKLREMKELLQQLDTIKPYMWINAYKEEKRYYQSEHIEFLKECDPLFEINLKEYLCKDLECKTGEWVFYVEWNGNIHRCWQDKAKIGNLYMDHLGLLSVKKNCRKESCGCFIGYSNIKNLNLEKVYKNSLLGRMP